MSDPIQAAKTWAQGEVRRQRKASGRASTVAGVVGYEARANHLERLLAELSRLEGELATVRDELNEVGGKWVDARRQIAERDEALKPFAARIVDIGIDEDDADRFSNALTPYSQSVSIKVGHIRRAAALLASPPSGVETFSPEAKRQAWSLLEQAVEGLAPTNNGGSDA